MFICRQKNQLHHPCLWYCKDIQTSYFVYFGHASLHTPKMIEATWTRLLWLSARQKMNFIIHFFLEILHVKESCNLIGWYHFGPAQNFARYGIGGEISATILVSILDYFQKNQWLNFSKNKKKLFWAHFGPILPKFGQKWIFLEKRALSVFSYCNYLPSC